MVDVDLLDFRVEFGIFVQEIVVRKPLPFDNHILIYLPVTAKIVYIFRKLLSNLLGQEQRFFTIFA